MKLSEAIRAGAKLAPRQLRNFYFAGSPTIQSACALGTAWLGAGGDPDGCDVAALVARWPELGDGSDLFDQIKALNDDRRWSREHIAKWLETRGL